MFFLLRPAVCFAAIGILSLGAAPGAAQEGEASIRIGLLDRVESLTFSVSSPGQLFGNVGQFIGLVRSREAWHAHRAPGNQLRLVGPEATISAIGPVRLIPSLHGHLESPLVFVGTRWYRGILELRPGIVAINEVPLEQYLYGVIPAEMPYKWPIEALKAQAVAARTYTIAKLGDMSSRGYDLKPTTDHQVYAGAAGERAQTNDVVDATRGEVLTYNGRAIPAYYCSAAGGYTDGAETVWGGSAVPYLAPVPDFDQGAPSYLWERSLTATELRTRLARLRVAVGDILDLEPQARGYSGRVKSLYVRGTRGTKVVSGERFRWATGLKSSLFNVGPVVESGKVVAFTFAGRGHGHGLGLSQWGARGMGQMGYNYIQILSHYYPGALLSRSGMEPYALH